ncbi:hypothetical protein [Nitrosomonas ureae]|uniref:Uncharacterized protein n=1 Tax=Nitrosomonas ureae TaxID=44577 RepID=A0A286A294_9PROT|nr:hypothetical protein [Nitrosomonas ureae]SOD15981.1 hypothetical protein SAMN06297164_0174 [Nitrosomonas ureae]
MEIQDIRRANLQAMVDAEGLSVVAKKFQLPERQINDMLKKRKAFGEKIARRMEENHSPKLALGWLDKSEESTLPEEIDNDLLRFLGIDREKLDFPQIERIREFVRASNEHQSEAINLIKKANTPRKKKPGEGTKGK